MHQQDISTLLIHGDKEISLSVEKHGDIAPPIHLSTTFEVGNELGMVYSRYDAPTRNRVELLLGKLDEGEALLFSSGMAATFVVFQHFKPKRVAIDRGYHVTHQAIAEWFGADFKLESHVISLDEPYAKGDVIWVETPKNPTCELHDISAIASKAHAVGAVVVVDGTFASPVLQKPLLLGADVVMHSATKSLAGHSDVLAGLLVVKEKDLANELRKKRAIIGSVPGNLECFLLLRSLRTLSLRVLQQSESAHKLAQFLSTHSAVERVWHPLLPTHPSYELCKKQMKAGPGVFSIELKDPRLLEVFLKKLNLFTQATSLGGVESLVDWRYRYDKKCPETLLRISVGLEDPDDLINDLKNALSSV